MWHAFLTTRTHMVNLRIYLIYQCGTILEDINKFSRYRIYSQIEENRNIHRTSSIFG